MKHLFLINPQAGKSDRSQEVLAQVRALAQERALEYEAVVTRYPGHARELARAAAERGGPVRIYACGGDGTLNEAAVGAAGFDHAAVTTFPIGSGNDFIRMFGPGAERFRDLTALLDGPQARADLIECNGRLALNVLLSLIHILGWVCGPMGMPLNILPMHMCMLAASMAKHFM